jgi:hypothetical protein
MIERLDPFNLPQQGADRLALSSATPKNEKNDGPSDGPRASQVPRQRKARASRRK